MRESGDNVDLKVKLGHKSHPRVRVWSCSRANGTRSSSAKTGMTNRTIVVEVDAPSVVLVVYIKINNDFVCRVIINIHAFGSKRSRSPFMEGYDCRRSTAVQFS